jgi:hypothetical protein
VLLFNRNVSLLVSLEWSRIGLWLEISRCNGRVTFLSVLMQAMNPSMFNNFPGYANGFDDVIALAGASQAYVQTPQVVTTVREHFNCSDLPGAELEDDGSSGSRYSHWDQRIFQVYICALAIVLASALSLSYIRLRLRRI